jgi:hypothetical protein
MTQNRPFPYISELERDLMGRAAMRLIEARAIIRELKLENERLDLMNQALIRKLFLQVTPRQKEGQS